MYGPRAAQVSRTLGALPALGWQPTAVTLAPKRRGPHWFGAPNDALRGVALIRVPSPEEWLIVRAARRIMPSLRDYPDPSRVWVPRASRAAIRAAGAHAFAGLITFGQPWSDHLVGLRVHRAARLPWVAHFSDPWADSPYATPRQRSIWRRMEEDVVREATAVVFVTQEAADLVMSKYPAEWRGKVAVVPHGFDPSAPPAAAARRSGGGAMQLLYAGRFYRGVRTPIPLLRALTALNQREGLANLLHVTFVGPHVEEYGADAAALGVASLTTFRGRVSAAEIARATAAADVLLVVDAPSDGPSVFLPSKVVDYLAFRKPIFGITPASGASATLLRRLGAHVAPPDDVPAVTAAIEDLIARWRSGTLDVGSTFDAVATEYDIRNTTRRLDAVLQRACA